MKISFWKISFCSLLFIFCSLVVAFGVGPVSWRSYVPSWFPQKSVVLGLDLQGGVHLSLEIDEEKFFQEQLASLTPLLRQECRTKKIRYRGGKAEGGKITIHILDVESVPDGSLIYDDRLNDFFFTHGLKAYIPTEGTYELSFLDKKRKEFLAQAVKKSIEVIRRRIDSSGTMEPFIQSEGDKRIIVQIPGFDDPERVRALLGKTAKLSFQWVHAGATSEVPRGYVSMKDFAYDDEKKERENYTWVSPELLITGEDVEDCRASYDHYGKPTVVLRFTGKGGQAFSRLTKENIGRNLGIILDEQVLSAPTIQGHIPPGQDAHITNIPTLDEAAKLSVLIRSGALPAPLKVTEEKVVGPGLGKDSVDLGLKASIFSFFSVVGFMFLIYSFFGIFAIIGVTFNILLLLGSMILLGSTLTLPGIAGIALTMGMAVDANVLINERIKEELGFGKSLVEAIDLGYHRALTSIIDSNVTTLIGAAVLYIVGTGPVRGFAVSMFLGIVISFFTAVTMTKWMVFGWLHRWRSKSL